jgi:hypothetical protein
LKAKTPIIFQIFMKIISMTRENTCIGKDLDSAGLKTPEKTSARRKGPADLWKVPKAGHCGARAIAGHEFDKRVKDWFSLYTASCNISALN